MPELSVLIVNYNSWRECVQAIATLREFGPTRPDGSAMPFEVIVVDNQSPRQPAGMIASVEHELKLLREQQGDEKAGVLVMHTENSGYSKGMNLAMSHSRGKWILVSNPDVLFSDGLVSKLLRQLENDPKAGIAVPKGFWDTCHEGHLPPNSLPTKRDAWSEVFGVYSSRFRHWRVKRLVKQWQDVWLADKPVALPMMSGCLFLVDRDYFESIGKFDERFPLYYEDADLSVKIIKSGRAIMQVPDSHLVHFVNRSGMSDLETMWSRHAESRGKYYRKWYPMLGKLTLSLTSWLLNCKKLARFRQIHPREPYIDLGQTQKPPVLKLSRKCERYLVLMSLDLRFFLAAGIYGSGDQWSPSDKAFEVFVNANFFFCVFDISNGKPEFLGTWRYYCMSHLGVPVPMPETVAPAPRTVAPMPEADGSPPEAVGDGGQA
ncbi:MAG: GT2 family glycosyltransferase [Neolewinella sp.]|jgi:GT2 family glycosyltransferase